MTDVSLASLDEARLVSIHSHLESNIARDEIDDGASDHITPQKHVTQPYLNNLEFPKSEDRFGSVTCFEVKVTTRNVVLHQEPRYE